MRFGGEAEILGLPVDSLFNNWGSGGPCDFLDGGSKLLESDEEMTKVTMETLDSMVLDSSHDGSLAELKPLPPFTGYTGHLSINGISGHHYHAIANQQPPSPTPSHEAAVPTSGCNPGSVGSTRTSSNGSSASSVMYKNNGATLYYEVSTTAPEQGVVSSTVDCVPDIKIENDYNTLLPDEIAELIGSAMADTTVPSVVDGLEDPNASRDSWMEFLEGACLENGSKTNGNNNSDFTSCDNESVSLQQLLQHGSQYGIHTEVAPKQEPNTNFPSSMSLLQSRLQNGPPNKSVQENATSSTSYLNGGSPPGHVSTTAPENFLLNGRYIQDRSRNYPPFRSLKVPSPDMMVSASSMENMVSTNFPHTTTSNHPSKKSRSRSKKSNQMMFDGIGILGKEKPIHHCSVCNRGFLNKSNIKVHLRTHTGEKPFRCDVCSKPFRQKAHLIKHQQMHKRVGRD